MKRSLMSIAIIVLLAGCASDPGARRERIVKEHAGRLPAPSAPLSSYGKFELKPMEMVESVAEDEGKAAVAKDLEFRVQAQSMDLELRDVDGCCDREAEYRAER